MRCMYMLYKEENVLSQNCRKNARKEKQITLVEPEMVINAII